MNTQQRRQKIEEALRAEGFCSVTSLAKSLGVSEVTIRNDLSVLEDEKKVTRIHGGAILTMERTRGEYFEERSSVHQDKKLWIARRAASLVENYDSIFLDASTTIFYMANYLKNHHGLTVFTNGIEVAFRLAENRSNKVVLTGGLLRPETASLAGQFGNGMLGGIRANKAFFSCAGWSLQMELMESDLLEAQLKKEMVEAAELAFLLVDSSKFERQGLARFASMHQVTMVVTDDQVSRERLLQLQQANIDISVCSEHSTYELKGGGSEQRIRIGFANQHDQAPFQTLVRQGLLQAARAANVELLLADNHEDGPTALANAQYFVQQHVDLVAEFNTDVGYNNVIMEYLRSANIPVIAIDIPMSGATFVGVDNYKAGLMAGRLAGVYVRQCWHSRLDKLISLGLPSSGPVPAARMQGQIAGVREFLSLSDEQIISLDSKNTYAESHKAVLSILPSLQSAHHIAIFGINDEVVMGALAAFADAGISERVIAIAQGADLATRQELQKSGSRMIGAVTAFPERYGELIVATALQIVQGKQVPPAVYTRHVLVVSEETMRTLSLEALSDEVFSILQYDAIPFSHSESLPPSKGVKVV